MAKSEEQRALDEAIESTRTRQRERDRARRRHEWRWRFVWNDEESYLGRVPEHENSITYCGVCGCSVSESRERLPAGLYDDNYGCPGSSESSGPAADSP